AQLLERRARLRLAIGQRVDTRERQADLGAVRVELARPLQLRLGVGVPTGLEVGGAEVREAERIVGRELRQLGELGLGLGELIALQVAQAQHARAVQLFDGGTLGARAREQEDGRDERQAAARYR